MQIFTAVRPNYACNVFRTVDTTMSVYWFIDVFIDVFITYLLIRKTNDLRITDFYSLVLHLNSAFNLYRIIYYRNYLSCMSFYWHYIKQLESPTLYLARYHELINRVIMTGDFLFTEWEGTVFCQIKRRCVLDWALVWGMLKNGLLGFLVREFIL